MLTISKALSGAQAERYYEEEYRQGDYYLGENEPEVRGEWFGAGAERLGLSGATEREAFLKLLDGQSPEGERLVKHSRGAGRMAHRAGWDATFSAPKSVSIAALVGGDERLRAAHEAAVRTALREVEREAQVRCGAKRTETRRTENAVMALFTHEENRNLEPQLHTHAVICNATYDEKVGGWRALESREIYKEQEHATATYRAELAARMKELGYQIEIDDLGAPQIAGIGKEIRDGFSTRRREVVEAIVKAKAKAAAAGRELTRRAEAQIGENAARSTRGAKRRDVNPAELREDWRRQSAGLGLDAAEFVESAKQVRTRETPETVKREAAREATERSLRELTERESAATAKEVETRALKMYAYAGTVRLEDVRRELAERTQRGELIREAQAERTLYTTPELQGIERATLATVRRGVNQVTPLAAAEAVATAATAADAEGRRLNEDQEAVFRHLATTRDQFTAVHGKAGTGKSFTYKRFADFAESRGFEVRALAPTIAAADVLTQDGLKAETVQRHIRREASEPSARPQIWLTDEAGLLGARDMRALLAKAEREGARVILAGDVRQHASVPAGRAYAQLLDAGLSRVELNKITRQDKAREEIREAVRDLSDGKVKRAFGRLDAAGALHEEKDAAERYARLANLYAESDGETLVVTATNEERRAANRAIRRALTEHGKVSSEGFETEVLINRNVTREARKDAASYEIGDRVKFEKIRHESLRPNEWLKVADRDLARNTVTVEDAAGRRTTYDPRRHYGISDVYATERRTFAAGDRVQFRAAHRAHGVRAGDLATVVGIDAQGRAVLDGGNGKLIGADLREYKTIDYGYATTGHAAQGRTVDHAILLMTGGHREEVVNRAAAYVGVSRTRRDVTILTDDRERLTRDAERTFEKRTALDVGASPAATRESKMTDQEIDDILSGKNWPAPTREVPWITPPEKAQTPTAPSQTPKVSKGVPPPGFSRYGK
jgi:conjugative relaxase-like TrwC/TraI family protein